MSFTPCAVTGNISTILGVALQSNAFVRFRLRNFSGAVPRVPDNTIVTLTQQDVFPDSEGNISTNLVGNDVLQPANTYYSVEFWGDGRCQFIGNWNITGTAFDLTTTPPIDQPGTFETVGGDSA